MYDRTWIALMSATSTGIEAVNLSRPGGNIPLVGRVMGIGLTGFVLEGDSWDPGRAAGEVSPEGIASTGTVLAAFGPYPFDFRLPDDAQLVTIYVPAPAVGQVALRIREG